MNLWYLSANINIGVIYFILFKNLSVKIDKSNTKVCLRCYNELCDKRGGGGTTSNVDDIDSIPTMSDYLIITCRNTYINDHMTSDKISMSLQWI